MFMTILPFISEVGTGAGGHCPLNVHRGDLVPLQTLEGYNISIITRLSTKVVNQVHKDPLHEYHL